jgi:HD-GYP domain-containing protein (c-di-GMP phosphodiesterase class II)
MEAIIRVMQATIGARDPYTVAHQQQVTWIARAIGVKLGFSDNRLQRLHVASSLHDLGKIAIPLEILSKPGKLTEIEFALIKTHPQITYDILKPLQFPESITQIMLQHHERLNGSGYPRGLRGHEILPEARALAIADVVEAMCSHRPYRPTLGLEQALEEISRNKGILYDGEVVDVCLRLCDQGQLFPEEATVTRTSLPYEIVAPASTPIPASRPGQTWNKQQLLGNHQLIQKIKFVLHTVASSTLGCMLMLALKGT